MTKVKNAWNSLKSAVLKYVVIPSTNVVDACSSRPKRTIAATVTFVAAAVGTAIASILVPAYAPVLLAVALGCTATVLVAALPVAVMLATVAVLNFQAWSASRRETKATKREAASSEVPADAEAAPACA